jgi:hypothetical protein
LALHVKQARYQLGRQTIFATKGVQSLSTMLVRAASSQIHWKISPHDVSAYLRKGIFPIVPVHSPEPADLLQLFLSTYSETRSGLCQIDLTLRS